MPRAAYHIPSGGVQVPFDLYYEPGRTRVLIICPGFFQSKDTKTFQQLSQALAEEHDVLCLDFRGHGTAGGRFTFSAKEDGELRAVLVWANARYPHRRVMGFSLGGAIAINAISRQRDSVEALIAVSAPATFEDIEFEFWTPAAIRTGLRGLERGVGCRPGNPFLKKPRPIEQIARLEGLPILFIHGTHDRIVSAQHSRRLFVAAKEPKQLQIIQGGGHAEALFRDDPDHFLQLVNTWLRTIETAA